MSRVNLRSLALLGVLVAPTAWGASVSDGVECLAANDLPCAKQVVDDLDAETSSDPDAVALAGHTAFYDGRFSEAHDLLARARDLGWDDRYQEVPLAERTRDTMEDFTVARRDHRVVRYRPGVDAVMIDDAFRVLELAERHVAPLLGGRTPGELKMELYPDGRSFVAASSLPESAVKTTGVVALSKWSRLLVTSPRALGRGYAWQDTVAHEYVHLVVSHQTHDRAPVWLQEGIAKYLEGRWKDGRERFHLDPRAQGLLAEAIASDDFVSFEEMHPSLALLPSPDRAALAYAQVATMVAFAFEKGGDDVLTRVLPRVKSGELPQDALTEAAGYKKFKAFQEDWVAYIKRLGLIEKKLAEMPTVLDGGDAMDVDPVLSKRADLARWVRLGDLLAERGRPKAALVEYDKAVEPGEPMSPLLSNRMAQAHMALGQLPLARRILDASLNDYPEFALSHKTMGALRREAGEAKQALLSYQAALALNPFDPAVQQALNELYTEVGQDRLAEKHARYLRILRRGGEG